MRRFLISMLPSLIAGATMTMIPADATRKIPTHPDTIMKVSGSKANGFTVTRYDGTRATYPPLRVALAECRDGLDTEGYNAYTNCVVSQQVEYANLVDLKRTTRHYRQQIR